MSRTELRAQAAVYLELCLYTRDRSFVTLSRTELWAQASSITRIESGHEIRIQYIVRPPQAALFVLNVSEISVKGRAGAQRQPAHSRGATRSASDDLVRHLKPVLAAGFLLVFLQSPHFLVMWVVAAEVQSRTSRKARRSSCNAWGPGRRCKSSAQPRSSRTKWCQGQRCCCLRTPTPTRTGWLRCTPQACTSSAPACTPSCRTSWRCSFSCTVPCTA